MVLMQLPLSPEKTDLAIIEAAIHPARLGRYLSAAKGSKDLAFQFYVWNCALCEAFFLTMHFCEICTRNSIQSSLIGRFGEHWYLDRYLGNILSQRFKLQLDKAVQEEIQQHGAFITGNHVASALTFGFWEHLLTKRFEPILWKGGTNLYFKGLEKSKPLEEIRNLLIRLRQWRNRIAHHRAIFDKGPMKKHQEALQLIRWSCPVTAAWVAKSSLLPRVISMRPKG